MLRQVESRCPKFSSVWLVGINFLYFLVGILFIALSSWGISQQKEDAVTRALPAGGLVTLVVVGVFLMLVAIIGWIGVKFNYRIGGRVTLGLYAVVLIIIMIMEFAAAGALFTFTGRLDNFGPAMMVKDYGVYYLMNQSYVDCCCGVSRCPNDTCWIPAKVEYPCNDAATFRSWLTDYIDQRIIPIGVIAILVGLLQFATAITACVSQCRGNQVEQQKKLASHTPYDGGYAEGDDAYGTYGYESYMGAGNSAAAPKTNGTTGGATSA